MNLDRKAPNPKLQAPEKPQSPSLNGRGLRVARCGERRRYKSSKLDIRCPVMPLLLLGLWTLDFGLWIADAQSTNTPARFDYSSFRIVTDRNIFNPRRSTRYVRRERGSGTAIRAESFALVGTMSYEKGLFAFFDGSSSDYRKVLKQDETIAGFKVAAIQPAFVKLASPSNQVELRVGMQLAQGEEGEWRVSERSETAAPSGSSRFSAPVGSRRPAGFGEQSALPGAPGGELQPAPTPDGGTPPLDVADPQEPATAETAAPPSGSGNDVLERLRRRAAAERGENPQ